MLDVVSTILSFTSILQNIHNKKSIEDKVSEIRYALDRADGIYALLLEAKESHDEFEKFEAAAMSPLSEFLREDNKTQKQIYPDQAYICI